VESREPSSLSGSLGTVRPQPDPTPVALTTLAAGAVLAPAVNATFSNCFSTCGRQPPKASWTVPRRNMF
jgi:hypothetical protein